MGLDTAKRTARLSSALLRLQEIERHAKAEAKEVRAAWFACYEVNDDVRCFDSALQRVMGNYPEEWKDEPT